MKMFDTLDQRQQQIMTLLRDGHPLDQRQRFSAAALVAAGFLCLVEGRYELSDTGRALFETQEIEGQAVSDFQPDEAVEVSLWFHQPTDLVKPYVSSTIPTIRVTS